MSGKPSAQRVTLTPAHLVRLGSGLDAVRLQARGFGFLFGSLGVLTVRGTLDALLFRRFGAGRCRVLFLGLHGVAWASIPLPVPGRVAVPVVPALRGPALPAAAVLPSLAQHLTVSPPEPPHRDLVQREPP